MANTPAVAELFARSIAKVEPRDLPAAMRETCQRLLLDVIGLCVVARETDYVRAALAAWPEPGAATAIGHARRRSGAGAAFVNGTAAHGEDFDDTFEGGPVHAGAVVVPALLAAAEQGELDGAAVMLGIAVGAETICRLSLVVPKAVHKAGFHPTAVFGAIAAAAGVGAALRLDQARMVSALGIAGSMASGIIEYLADGAWTKRMHPGWAAQSGLRAAMLARAGFVGPRTVLEGTHGLFQGFAHNRDGNYAALLDGLGEDWVAEKIAFKPYPCGTMIHPYIDCARRLAEQGIDADAIVEIVCEAAEGTVHRLWEPLSQKQHPPNGYAAKFATPYCIAVGLRQGNVGLEDFTNDAVARPDIRLLAGKIRYQVDPSNPYPNAYTGHIRARLADGRVLEVRQPHLRGGAAEPLTLQELQDKFTRATRLGGWSQERIAGALALTRTIWDANPIDLNILQG